MDAIDGIGLHTLSSTVYAYGVNSGGGLDDACRFTLSVMAYAYGTEGVHMPSSTCVGLCMLLAWRVYAVEDVQTSSNARVSRPSLAVDPAFECDTRANVSVRMLLKTLCCR